MFKLIYIILFTFTSLSIAQHIPGKERGNPSARSKAQLDTSKLRITVQNFGLTGRKEASPIYEQTPYEWPKNTGKVYLAMTQLWIGGEVTDNLGNTIHLVDIASFRSSPEEQSWNFEPIPGYYNQNYYSPENFKIADSRNPLTWPDYWPDRLNDIIDPGWNGSWDGYKGKNKFVKGQELYYKMSDDRYDRYQYFPDSTDLTRRGLGLIVSCRAIELSDRIFDDLAFFYYKIKNDGTKAINKMGLTLWVADFIGGDGDSQDDKVVYDTSNNFVYFYDTDGKAPSFGDDPVGMSGIAFLNTPLQNGITNIRTSPAGSININNDSLIWSENMIPGFFENTSNLPAGEYDTRISSSYFLLEPGEETEFLMAVVMGNGLTNNEKLKDIYDNLFIAKEVVRTDFEQDKLNVTVLNPPDGKELNGLVEIDYLVEGNTGTTINYLLHSDSNGDEWKIIAIDSSNTGQFLFNTSNLTEGILNKIQIYSFADNGSGLFENEKTFTITNSNTSVAPQIYITSPSINDSISGLHKIEWISGDSDADITKINLYYRFNNSSEWQPVAQNLSGVYDYQWDTREFPNSSNFQLLGEAISNQDTAVYIIPAFIVNNYHPVADEEKLDINKNTYGNGVFEIHIVNDAELTGHNYVAVFDTNDNNLFYSVKDLTENIIIFENGIPTDGSSEGPYFDGIRLYIKSNPLQIDPLNSHWSNDSIHNFVFERVQYLQLKGVWKSSDYKIIFGERGIDTSLAINFANVFISSKHVNFKVFNNSENKEINFVFIEVDSLTDGPGIFSLNNTFKDRIVFWEETSPGTFSYTYWVYMSGFTSNRIPAPGDTLVITQFKPFLEGDSIYFSTKKITSVDDNTLLPVGFFLYPNYPNPFNPVTALKYDLPVESKVELKVFDILGREISTLVNTQQKAGRYEIQFDGRNYSSGIYLYRLKAGNYSRAHKMLLIK